MIGGGRLAGAALMAFAHALAHADEHRYDVALERDLARMTVTACLAGRPRALRARAPDAGSALISARTIGDGKTLRRRGDRIVLDGASGCVEYVIDLAAGRSRTPQYRYLDDANIVVSPSVWLWRPVNQAGFATEVRFTLAAGMAVSVPWTPLPMTDGGQPAYRIPLSPQSDDAATVFGAFEQHAVQVPGATLRTAVLRGKYPGNTRDLLAWVEKAANDVALTYGRFPNPQPQVLVVPVANHMADDNEPVPFGHVIRDGGEAVQFYVNQRRDLDAFLADWTATHEFSHLLIPYVSSDEKWISEGLASYYQNVLMARSGRYNEEQAWRKIYQGFKRGVDSVPHLSLESAMPMGGWDGIMKTYWGGAAVFLFADVELRERSGNTASLDSVLARLRACCLPSKRMWDGRTFFAKLDELSPESVFVELYERYRGEKRFPDFEPIFEALGISTSFGRMRINDEARLAPVRRSIMAGHAGAPAQAASSGELAPGASQAAGAGY